MTAAQLAIATEQRAMESGIPRYELLDWWEQHGLVAGVTGRGDGFDMRLPPAGEVTAGAWRSFLAGLDRPFDGVVVGRQVHHTRVERHADPVVGLVVQPGIDGHVTSIPGLLLAVTIADCVPVYLAHPPTGSIALLHAGWRGIAAGILSEGVNELCDLASANVADILMHCGIGICGRCYEVGSEVVAEVTGNRATGESDFVDLRGVLADRARGLGIRQISCSPWCTAHDADRFYSHRASGGPDGRMAAYLGRPGVGSA